jgi:succinate dehydrogenase / fumarate reductase cytochrome b subunit
MFQVYRGSEGQWAWVLHRVSGLAVLVFLLLHVVDIALVGWGPHLFDDLLFLYRHPVFRVGEFLVFAGVLYHALNGLRIIAIDFFTDDSRVHRRLFWVAMASYAILLIPVFIIMLNHYLESLHTTVASVR